MALAETTRAQPIGEQPRFPNGIRTLTQVAVGLAALALIPLHVSAFGTPWRSLASAAIEADQPIPLPSGGSGYFKVNNSKDHPQWYEVKGLPDKAELSVRKEQDGRPHSHVLEQTLLLLMPGTTLGSIVQPRGDSPGRSRSRCIRCPTSSAAATITLSETERTPYLLKLTKDEHTRPTWEGAWYSRIQDAPDGSSLVMVFPETSSDLTGEFADLGRGRATFGIPVTLVFGLVSESHRQDLQRPHLFAHSTARWMSRFMRAFRTAVRDGQGHLCTGVDVAEYRSARSVSTRAAACCRLRSTTRRCRNWRPPQSSHPTITIPRIISRGRWWRSRPPRRRRWIPGRVELAKAAVAEVDKVPDRPQSSPI